MTNDLFKFVLSAKYSTPLELTYAPLGWNEVEFELRRDPDVHGVFELSNIPLRFHDGYKSYILSNYNQYGVDAEIEIDIQALQQNGAYKSIFKGLLDLTTLVKQTRATDYNRIGQEIDDYLWLECDIINNSPGQKLRERAGVEFRLETQLSPDGVILENYAMPYRLPMHSQAIFRGGRFRILPVNLALGGPSSGGIIKIAGPNAGSDPGYWVAEDSATPTFNLGGGSTKFLIKNIADTSVFTLFAKGTLRYDYELTGDEKTITFGYVLEGGPPTTLIAVWGATLFPNSNFQETVNFDFAVNFNLASGQHVWAGFVITHGTNPGDSLILNLEFSDIIQITTASTQAESWNRGWLVFEALQKSIDFATDKQTLLSSNVFGRLDSQPTAYPSDGRHSLYFVSNGLRIRDLIDAKGPQLSYKKLYDSLNACFCLGWSEKRVSNDRIIEIETRDYFYQSEVIKQFSNVPNIVVRAARDLYFQRARFGFSTYEIDETNNSLDEFCTQHTRFNFLKTVNNEYNAVCDFVASGYAIERLRRIAYEGDPTKGDKYDENNFIISLKRGENWPFETARNEDFESVGGCFSPNTRYNLKLSPSRNFTRHLKWLNGSLWKIPNQFSKWIFGTGEGNINLQTQDIEDADFADVLAETQDITTSQSDLAIYYPEFIEFTVPLDLDLWFTLLDLENKYKAIEVSNAENNYLKGWIWSVKIMPNYPNNWDMAFTLLSFGNGYDFANIAPPEPPSLTYDFAYIANSFVLGGSVLRGILGTQSAEALDLLKCGENVIIRWWHNGNTFTESHTISPAVSGGECGGVQIYLQNAFSNLPGSTQLNGVNMKIRIVSSGVILKFGPQADQLLANP
jgi:hypothetical protein